MPYLIETWDKAEHAPVRQARRPEHLAWLEAQRLLLLACGAKLNDDGAAFGSFYIVDVDSREEAERFIEADPFSRVGLPERVVITRWRMSFLDRRSYL